MWMKKQFAAVGGYVDSYRRIEEPENQNTFIAGDLRVRSLIRLKKWAEALEAAKAADKVEMLDEGEFGSPFFESMVRVSNREFKVAAALLTQCVRTGYDSNYLYDDTDIGPHLRMGPYAQFRAHNPPPAPKYARR